MKRTVVTSFTGTEELHKNLDKLEKVKARKASRKAIGSGTKILLKEVKSRVPVRYGVLRRSLGRVLRARRQAMYIVGVVGPRHGFATKIDGEDINPVYYAHLVEFGTYSKSNPSAFMRRSWDAKGQAIQAEIVRVMKEGLSAKSN